MPAASPNVDSLVHAAREWFDAGYSVVPSHEDGSKRPFGKWKGYQTLRMPIDDLITILRTGQHSGIGATMGTASDNTEMMEIEGPLEQTLRHLAKLKAVAERMGLIDLLNRVLNGCVAHSAGGGIHIFIRITDGPAKPNTKLATTADGKVIAETRGEGGFVIVAPTPARKGHTPGAVYLLVAGTTPANTAHVTSAERDHLHTLFTAALHEGKPDPEPTTPREPKPPTDGLTPWDDYANRNTWADILTPHGWQQVYTAPDGRTHWTRPGKSIHDGTSATTIEDGPLYVFSTSTPFPSMTGMSKQYAYAALHHGGDMKAAARALNEAGYGDQVQHHDLPPWLPPDVDPDSDEAKESRSSWVREKFPLVDWHALWADETEEEWIVEPLLAARRLVALYSAPKVGKSLLMLELAAGIASGKEMLGHKAKAPKRVLYVDFENDPRGDIRRRLEDMDYSPDELGNLCYLTFPTMAALDSEAGSQELLAAVLEYGCEVVVIDTVSRAIKGEENENDTWLAFYRHTGLKMKQHGIALIRLDHAGKDESKGQRGGSAKSGDVDAVWRMSKRSEDVYDLICEAKRFPIAEDNLTIRRHDDPLRHVVDVSAAREVRRQLLDEMAEAQVPKDPSLNIKKQVHPLVRQMGVKFTNKVLSKDLWLEYCRRPGVWNPTTLKEE